MYNLILNFYKGKKVHVTGGASFIGSHLVELLLDSGAIVTVTDDLSSGVLSNLAAVMRKITFIKGDLRNVDFANSSIAGSEVVFHLAAQHGGRGYIESHPVECSNNMLLDHIVFAAAVKSGCKSIIYASSACTYPTNLQASTTERLYLKESDANFEEPGKAFSDGEYGWAKLMGELQLRAFCKQYKIDGVACRIFTAYGERENESHAVVALIAKAALKIDPYPIWGDGTQTRNFTYVKDTVMGLALSGATLKGFSVINAGRNKHDTILELIEQIFTTLNWRPQSILKELHRPVGVLSRSSDNTLCKKLLNWEPTWDLASGIQNTAKWYIDNLTPEIRQRLEKLLLERN